MKLTKTELKQKISDSIPDNEDLVISLLEDIEDSFPEEVEDNTKELLETKSRELEDVKMELDEIKTKYKERFLTSNEVSEDSETEVVDEGLKEDVVKDIFL